MNIFDKIHKSIEQRNNQILKSFGIGIEKGEKDISKLIKKVVTVTRNGRTFQQTVYVSPETGREVEVPTGHEISPDVRGVKLIKYSDKAILISGETYVNIDTLHKIKNELGIGSWNKQLKGWLFPVNSMDVVLGHIYSGVNIEDENSESKKEEILEFKNAYKVGTKVKGNKQNGVITDVHFGNEITYDVKTDDGQVYKGIKEKLIQVLPETDDKKVSELINSAVPENRNNVEIQINGTSETQKTIEEVVKEEAGKANVVTSDFTPTKTKIKILENSLEVNDYSNIASINIVLPKDKDILEKPKPPYIPSIDEKSFVGKGLFFDALKVGEDKYLVALNGYTRGGTKGVYGNRGYENVQTFLEDSNFAIMSLDLLTATTRYYQSKAKAENKKNAEASGKKVKRLSVLGENRANYSHMHMFDDMNPWMEKSAKNKEFWKNKRELYNDLKQKSIDMELQMEDLDNAYSKGRETSYGDSKTKDDLLKDLGVKVKRQNGDEIKKEEVDQIKEQLQSVYSVFGDRSSMAKNWGLKISHAGEKAMHAMKAQGVFFPHYNAIGVSFGNDKNKEGGFTLAHEFAHFMDYWVGKKEGSHFGSDKQGSLSNEIARTFRKNMNDVQSSNYQNRTCEVFARAFEQYYSYKTNPNRYTSYTLLGNHVNKDKFETQLVPLIERYLKENNELLKSVRFKNLS